jgi:hypothetical protein
MADREVFTLKHFNAITAGMINEAIGQAALRDPLKRVLTDFFVGSVSRTLLEAVAIEIEQLYFRTFLGIRDAIPVAIFQAFDFDRLPAAAATGNVTFTEAVGATGIITIPQGTVVQTATGIQFETVQSATLDTAAEDDVTVPVQALVAGADGNVGANSITFKKSSIQNIASLTNALPTSGGQDEESDADRKVRFENFISNLTRATRRAVEVGALNEAKITDDDGVILEQVKFARVYEPFNVTDNTVANGAAGDPENFDVGFFELYIDNGSGTSSTNLVENEAMTHSGSGQFIGATGGAVSTIPVAPFSVTVTMSGGAGGTRVATDDGAGNMEGDVDAGGANTINYTNGQIDLTSNDSGDDTAVITYNGGDEGLVQVAQRVIDGFDDEGELIAGWKGAGVVVEVKPVTPVTQNVTARIEMNPGVAFTTAQRELAEDAVAAYFDSLGILEKISFENLLVAISNASPDYFEVTLINPNADVAIAYFERAILGTVSITEQV